MRYPGCSTKILESSQITTFVKLPRHYNGHDRERLSSSARRLCGNMVHECIPLELLNELSSHFSTGPGEEGTDGHGQQLPSGRRGDAHHGEVLQAGGYPWRI